MSSFIGILTTPEVALTAATELAVVKLTAPTNHRLKVLSYSVAFDGVSVTGEPVVVKLVRFTTAGTFTSLTPTKNDDSLAETLQATAGYNASVAPTFGDIIARKNIHPQGGYEKIFPLGQEPIVGGADSIGIACTAPAGVNVIAEIVYEE